MDRSRKARLASAVQVAVNFSSRNQHAPETGKFPQHLSPNESADCFFPNPQLGCSAFYVESLAFGNCRRIHNFTFTGRQHTTDRDSFGMAAAQPRHENQKPRFEPCQSRPRSAMAAEAAARPFQRVADGELHPRAGFHPTGCPQT